MVFITWPHRLQVRPGSDKIENNTQTQNHRGDLDEPTCIIYTVQQQQKVFEN